MTGLRSLDSVPTVCFPASCVRDPWKLRPRSESSSAVSTNKITRLSGNLNRSVSISTSLQQVSTPCRQLLLASPGLFHCSRTERLEKIGKSRRGLRARASARQLVALGRDRQPCGKNYRVAMAFVINRFNASSFFFNSSGDESSISSCAIASLTAVSIFSLLPRFILMAMPGSLIMSSTRLT